jgi:hypothetical protein
MNELERQFDHHYRVIRSQGFLGGQGLGNEVPFFISTFPAERQLQADELILSLYRRLRNEGMPLLKINLLELCLELLEREGVLEEYLRMEPEMKKPELKESLTAELDVPRVLAPEIGRRLKEEAYQALFLTGVGPVYPFLRSHNLLTNLQSIAKSQPTILFFPGRYTFVDGVGSSLDLFGMMNEDRYYRAFHLNHYHLQEEAS